MQAIQRNLINNKSLNIYLEDISRFKGRPPDKVTKELYNEIIKGDEVFNRIKKGPCSKELGEIAKRGIEARNKLVYLHLNYVVAIVKRLQAKFKRIELEDLIQAGNIGLVQAARRFDPVKAQSRGAVFTTYAFRWIMKFIFLEYQNQGWFVHIPDRLQREITWKNRIENTLLQKLQREFTFGELINAIELDKKCTKMEAQKLLRRVIAAETEVVSVDKPLGRDQKATLIDMIRSDNRVDLIIDDLFRSKEMLGILNTLNEKEKRILELRFGIGTGSEATLESVAKEFGVSGARVSEIELKALRKLRHPSRSKKVKDYLD